MTVERPPPTSATKLAAGPATRWRRFAARAVHVARAASIVAFNLIAIRVLSPFAYLSMVTVSGLTHPAVTTLLCLGVVGLISFERFGPGHGLRWHVAHVASSVWVLQSRRFQLVAAITLAPTGLLGVLGLLPSLVPELAPELVAKRSLLAGNPAYRLTLAADGSWLGVTHTHGAWKGLSVIQDPAADDPIAKFVPLDAADPHDATYLPDEHRFLVHDDPLSCNRGTPNVLGGHDGVFVVDATSGRSYPQIDLLNTHRSELDPRGGRLYLLLRTENRVTATTPTRFLSGEAGRDPSWPIPGVSLLLDVALDPVRENQVYLLGEDHSTTLVALDATSGTMRSLRVGAGESGLAVDPRGERIFVARWAAQRITVVRPDPLTVEREVTVLGGPRKIATLGELPAIAVVTYTGRAVLFLDTRRFEVLGRIPACRLGRDIAYDEERHTLYWADACGVHRASFSAAWIAALAAEPSRVGP